MGADALGESGELFRALAEERLEHVRFLESLDRVDRAIEATSDLEQMMRNVLDELLDIFVCDRAWLLYPCNPDSPTWMPRMERTRPEYPGALAVGRAIPTDPDVAATFRTCLDAPGPVTFGPQTEHPLPADVAVRFGFQSFVAMALRPRSGDPWEFGLHQCSYPRVWTPQEVRLFEEVGRRLADGLSNVLAHRDLLAAERRLRLALEAGKTGAFDVDLESGAGTWTAETATIWGIPPSFDGDLAAYCWSHLHPDDEKRIRAEFAAAVASASEHEMEFRVVRPDGTTRWLRWRGHVVANPDGHGLRAMGVNLDITEQKRAADALAEQERRFRTLVDNLPDLVVRYDTNLCRTYVNPAWEKASGLGAEEVVGVPVADVLPRSYVEPYFAALRRAIETGSVQKIEFRWVNARRETLVLDYVIAPEHDLHGRVVSLLAVGRDITERRRTEDALRRSEAELRRIIDTANEGICVLGPDAGCKFVNAKFAQMLGYAADEMIGRPVTDYMFEEDVPSHEGRMEARRRGISEDYERRFRRKDGQPLWTRVSATPIFEDDDFAGSFAMLTDITERRRAAEEVRTLNRELERQVLQYRMLLDQASDAIFVSDADRHYVDVNIAACDLLGYTREELLRLSIHDVVPPEENQGQPERFVRMRAGETVLSERTLRCKDGSLLVAELNSRQLPDGRFQAIVRDVTSRRRLEEEQARLATAVEQADEAIVITDPSASILYVNPSFERVSGYPRAELIGSNPRILHSGQHDAAFYREMWSTLLAGQTWHGILVNRRKDGSLYEEDAVITPIRGADGAVVSYVGVKRDITREQALEAQLRQSQKMEAIGQLAGGIAHDFNNLITAIRGYSELVRESLPPGDRDDIDQVVLAADRAAELTRQLLAFGRRQVLQPRVLAPAEIVEGIAPMLRRLLGEHIELLVHAAPDVGRIRVDPSKLEQIIVNLAVNARDAMPGGGRLVIETTNAEINARSEPAHAEMTPGPYVVLRVTDTGSGMDEETRARAFEPFFTTKEPGSGTGMGLAVVYGIVAASGGEIDLYSGLGQGTTFEIYLPRVDEEAIAAAVATEAAAVPRGSETILLVEDEASVRTFARRALEELGYVVIEASNGAEAAARATGHTGRIDLLVTDVVMPRVGGRELAERLRAARPELPILFMSGFSGNAVSGADLTPPDAPILAKPFTREGLGRAVRRALGAVE
jgi:two-component system cell cycle sensor histidine kinase/response regulator CckA